ncbi:MAG TPA: hypothetical protein VED22_02085 [Nitrososphaerales archaeon]|nr:hypothetical protein [Nitrososphaerales archaeon]
MPSDVIIVGSFLLAFKAVLLEGSEVAILSLATVKQLGNNNVLFGVLIGGATSAAIFFGIRQIFLLFPEAYIDILTGCVILYFSYRFLRGFKRYYFGKRSFRAKMEKMESETVERDFGRYGADKPPILPFSPLNALPVFAITVTEGFEASLVLSAAGAFNLEWTLIGAGVSLLLLVVISAISYDYLIRFPRWGLDLLAGSILLIFGTFFLASGLYALFFGVS